MTAIHGIIVHQTGAFTAQSTLNSYKTPAPDGAHFLIDKDGTVFQTASLSWKVWHVGKLRARCLLAHTCAPVEAKLLISHPAGSEAQKIERTKKFPDRFPANEDSIGIEIVGGVIKSDTDKNPPYEEVNFQQNQSLEWLVRELRLKFSVPTNEIYRHPDVSFKDPHEAESAKW
ncbi:MAG: peptidoglycan recognition family protein [Azospirillaceae bacterium]|nr:peptidoglycan recognition family protein [Azospirillaceae bacterium]